MGNDFEKPDQQFSEMNREQRREAFKKQKGKSWNKFNAELRINSLTEGTTTK